VVVLCGAQLARHGDMWGFVPLVGQNIVMNEESRQKYYVEDPVREQMKRFAMRLKELRAEHGLTTRQLQEKTGVSRGSITRWENCQSVIMSDQLIRLAEFFNVRVGYLLGVEEE